jgi:sigma-54 dependent transcriptional regulator, acetoin dehydrogenase operon transcriptional activator AcoR
VCSSASFRVLLLSERGILARLAHRLLAPRMAAWGPAELACAAVRPGPAPGLEGVLEEVGVTAGPPAAAGIEALPREGGFDLVLTLDSGALAHRRRVEAIPVGTEPDVGCQLAVGLPAYLHWSLQEPAFTDEETTAQVETLRRCLDALKRPCAALFDDGVLDALAGQRQRWVQLVETLEDGVLAHDNARRILFFNPAAERISGYSRDEVLGRDCHELFPPDGICGASCHFCEGHIPATNGSSWKTRFVAKGGVERQVKMSVAALRGAAGEAWGVTVGIHDLTEVSRLRSRLEVEHSFRGMVGASRPMQEIFSTLRQISTSDYPVLISGESGTGKELLANAVHQESRRKAGPFVPVNCGALPDNILESELFGHVRGAFTGAIRTKKGRFELAHKGTLFLDEVGELTQSSQVKLLRVLQEKRFEMVGGERSIQVDVRIISATNRDLRRMVAEGTFREDLFYRLCVVPVELPPLRDRMEDLPLLVARALVQIRKESDSSVQRVSEETMALLMSYSWPGNVRELINALQFASVQCSGEVIEPQHLPPEARSGGAVPLPPSLSAQGLPLPQEPAPAPRRKLKLTPEAVAEALGQASGNKVQAARLLGVGRATLYRFLKEHSV